MDKNNRTIAKQILLGLGYTDQFWYPLRRSELRKRLPTLNGSGFVSRNTFNSALSFLKKHALVAQKDSLFSLHSSVITPDVYVKTRRQRTAFAKKKRAELSELIAFLQKIPWITGVLITGSVAMNNATEDDDVDFLIITKPNSMWFVRPLVVVYAWAKKKRRSWKKEEKNSWCFNLWLEETCVGLPKESRSIYTAYELCQAEWVFAEPEVHRMYYSCNFWARSVLPELYKNARQKLPIHSLTPMQLSKRADLRLFFMYPVRWLNAILYVVQLFYMLPHKTSEKVGRGFAFFHPRDTRTQVFENWKTSLKRLVY